MVCLVVCRGAYLGGPPSPRGLPSFWPLLASPPQPVFAKVHFLLFPVFDPLFVQVNSLFVILMMESIPGEPSVLMVVRENS